MNVAQWISIGLCLAAAAVNAVQARRWRRAHRQLIDAYRRTAMSAPAVLVADVRRAEHPELN